jgi:hypothetical protein
MSKAAFQQIAEGMREAIAYASHNFDEYGTEFCKDCGQSRERILDHGLNCFGAANIVAVSHIIARRQTAAVFGTSA